MSSDLPRERGIAMNDGSGTSAKMPLALENGSRLNELKPRVDEAIAFADQWEDPYRVHIFRIALTHLIDDRRLSPFPTTNAHEGMQQVASSDESPLTKLSKAVEIDLGYLRRVIEIDEEGNVQILGQLGVSDSTSERQNKYSVVYAFIKEKALGVTTVDIEELRDLCKQHNCYNQANFTQYFRKSSRLRENKREGKGKRYIATRQGLEEAAALIRQMAEE